MTIDEVREYAGAVGVLMTNRYLVKDELIRIIQLSTGHDDCFGHKTQCRESKCEWYEDCLGRKNSDR